jgi:threonine dehydratase
VIAGRVERIVSVTEGEILDAMRFIWERIKILVEPSGAVAVAPLLAGKIDVAGLRVGVILSGGNVDLEEFFRELASRSV